MIGQPGTLFFAFSFFAFFLYSAKKMFNLPTLAKQKTESVIIARKEFIYSRNCAQNAVSFYFKSILRSLVIVAVCVFISALNFLFMVASIKTNGTPSPLWQVVLVVAVVFLAPMSVIMAKIFDTKTLKSDIMREFFR